MKAVAKTAKLAAPFVKGLKNIGKFGTKNANWIFALMGLLGLAGTTWQMVDATIKAVKLCEEKQIKGTKEIIRTVWKLYIPGAGFVILTTIAIAGHTRLNIELSKKLVTATGLYAASQADLKAFKEKAKEVLGEKKEQEKIEDGIVKDKLNALPPITEDQIISTGHGDKLFIEWLTGQLIRTSPEHVEAVSERMDNQFNKEYDGVCEVSYYLDQFGIETDCWVGRAVWDMAEMLQRGQKRFHIDCHELQWMTVNGKQEMVGIIRPPEPTGT